MVILPAQRLVIVRLGDSVDPTGDMRGLGRLVKEVIDAVENAPSFRGDAKQSNPESRDSGSGANRTIPE
jgi:hypothetical protein